MPFIIPIAAKVLATLAASETSAAPAAQKTAAAKPGDAPDGANFAQSVDDVSRNAAAAAQQSAHLTGRG
jgi:hypothetical protein